MGWDLGWVYVTCKISNIEKASPMGRLLSAQSDQTLTTNYIGEYINILANICRKGGVLSPSRYTRAFLHLYEPKSLNEGRTLAAVSYLFL